MFTILRPQSILSKFRKPVTLSYRFESFKSRPFRILGLQQIAIGSEDKSSLDRIWKDIFGLQPVATKRLETENVVEDIVQLGPSPYQVEIDLMVPINPNKSPKVHVPPLNHIGLWVDNLEDAVEWMEKQGVRFTPGGIRMGASGHNVTFIHPKGNDKSPISGNSVLIELVQAPRDVIDAFGASKET